MENTMKYIHRIDFLDSQRFDVAVASTIDEVEHLAEAGFKNLMKPTEYTFTGDRRDSETKTNEALNAEM
jgi:hypothetical protein